jgi:hypothetical protein
MRTCKTTSRVWGEDDKIIYIRRKGKVKTADVVFTDAE